MLFRIGSSDSMSMNATFHFFRCRIITVINMIFASVFLFILVECSREPRRGGSYRCYKCTEQLLDGKRTTEGGPCENPGLGTRKFTLICTQSWMLSLGMGMKEYDDLGCKKTRIRLWKSDFVMYERGTTQYDVEGCRIVPYSELNRTLVKTPNLLEHVEICNFMCHSDLCNQAKKAVFPLILLLILLLVWQVN